MICFVKNSEHRGMSLTNLECGVHEYITALTDNVCQTKCRKQCSLTVYISQHFHSLSSASKNNEQNTVRERATNPTPHL